MIYHVSVNGNDLAAGTKEAPFKTINHAAAIAAPGDTVQVHEGTYREWVDPKCGGFNEQTRITYEAAPGEHVVIKGSEIVTDWERIDSTVWKKVLPNTMFGEWNPYAESITGDWLQEPKGYDVHAGDVYLNGISLYEAPSMEALYLAKRREVCCQNSWRLRDERLLHPEQSVYQWFACVEENNTVLYCNFQERNPNAELIEINVRQSCFRPKAPGISYMTVRGFEMAHAATPWNPPTAEQIGMVGPNWAKGWIIEDCHLHDAKTSAISIGKEAASGHELSSRFHRKSGHRYQAEAVFLALQLCGWSKERVGSHLIRNNTIHDCGQNAVVGHMGCAFSRIEHNHIYNIGVKHEFWGHEMAGIKLHAAVDVVIENNHFHHCTLGTWLDWQAQGTRVTRNLYHHNDRDFMIEVTHGPCTVDHNLFLSDYSIDNNAQGTAFVHNLIAGLTKPHKVLDRATPYHLPHSTAVLGYAPVYGGDDRVINNLILGHLADTPEEPAYSRHLKNMCRMYDEYDTPEEYAKVFDAIKGDKYRSSIYVKTPQPVYIDGNAYTGYASPFRAEKSPITVSEMRASVTEKDGAWMLELTVPEDVVNADCVPVTTARLGAPRITEEPYENPDGTPIDFTKDYFGNTRTSAVIPGPFAALQPGTQCLVLWKV
ncbi:MAG: right-handed parallel beta-helix repeat-containing protein [Clostridia bacterium]|nr:right-handed parallel beta-helix repeat-containing protein [Clostridia bacterium]